MVGVGLIVVIGILSGVAIASNDDDSSTSKAPPFDMSYSREQLAELGILDDETEAATREYEGVIDDLLEEADMSQACEDSGDGRVTLRVLLDLVVEMQDPGAPIEDWVLVDVDRYVDQLCS